MKSRLAICLSFLFLAACATTAEMKPTQAYPASAGKVKFKKGDPNNEVQIEVDHLPPPNYIESGLTTYVVWLKASGDENWNNIGQIKVDKDTRGGELETMTPFESFEIRVTAEQEATASNPSDHILLGADIEGA